MNYIRIDNCDIANGSGVGVVLWVSGCSLHCEECHNQTTWDFNAGTEFTDATLQHLLNTLDKPYIKRLTITGGHPLEIQNQECVCNIINAIHEKFGNSKAIWLYTGLTLTDSNFNIVNNITTSTLQQILVGCNYVVDGPYIKELRDVSLAFRGSSNQRIIDCAKSFGTHKIMAINCIH